jgi:glycosyltransferase involved in cell wall biosynthesis
MFLFLGHTSEPERVLSACNILIRPSRECNPWGRDILEALSFGLPVIATGTYNNFVESKVTGFLMNEFDPKKVADCIVELFQNEQLVKHMGEQGKKRVQELCNGPDRARDLQNFWQKIVEQ